MSRLDFYFDIISPFAYFAFKRLDELPDTVEVSLKPVLFAGLLNHWESKGPAEIPPKRVFTYQYSHWYAMRHGIEFKCPPAHPFNPLPGLRLAIAAGCTREAVDAIFSFIWGQGKAFDDANAWAELLAAIGMEEPENAIANPMVKETLRENTATATQRGVFGVPSYVIDEQVFWGVDSLPMVIDYLNDPSIMSSEEMQRIADLPATATRKF